MPYFLLKFFFQYLFQINKKKLLKMATLTFRVGDHIFFIWYFKKHMTFFWDYRSKVFGNILKIFLISGSKIFKLVFMESLAENIRNSYFQYIQICPRFVSLLLFILWIVSFEVKLWFGRSPSKPTFIQN